MRSIWRTLAAAFLFFCILTLTIVAQPNAGAWASTTSSGGTASPATQTDVGIHVETIGSAFQPGDVITFTLAISNSGPDMALGIVVTDIVPAQILTSSFSSTLNLTPAGTDTYTWSVEPLGPGEGGVITITGQIDPALPDNFSFINAATITDPNDTTPNNNTSQVRVGNYFVFLPSVLLNWPPVPSVPSLTPISRPCYSGEYNVTWNTSANADTYTLQRDTALDFSHPSVIYDGPAISFQDHVNATVRVYYYRVRANNSWGNHSQWSNIASAQDGCYVDIWVYNETSSTITIEIVGVARRDFAPGTYMWLSLPWGTYTFNTWTQLYYYHLTQQLIGITTYGIHVGS